MLKALAPTSVRPEAVWGSDPRHSVRGAVAEPELDERQFARVLAETSAKENTSVNENMNAFSHTFVNHDLEARYRAFFAHTFASRLLGTCGAWSLVCVVVLLRAYAFGFFIAEEVVLLHIAAACCFPTTLALYHWNKPRMGVVRRWASREGVVVVLAVLLMVVSFLDVALLVEDKAGCDADDQDCLREIDFAFGYLGGMMYMGFALFLTNCIASFLHILFLASVLLLSFLGVFVVGYGHTVRPAAAALMFGVFVGMLWSNRSSDKFLRRQFLRALGTVHLTQQHLAGLEKAKEHKQRVVGYLFHEVRNPINDIVLASALALDAAATVKGALQSRPPNAPSPPNTNGSKSKPATDSAEELDGMLQVISRSAEAASHVLDDALDLQKLESGHFAFVKNVFEFAELHRPVVAALEPRFADKGVKLSVEDCPDLSGVTVEGDLKRLRQVLHNFLSNALKFTPADGQVVVSVTTSAKQSDGDSMVVRVAVSDTGIGLGKEDQAKMFTAWSQIRAAQTQAGGGTGLGLALSKDFVEIGHNGEIGCFSPGSLGCGSTFYFEISYPVRRLSPRQTEQDVAESVVARALPVADGAVGVLIVDDSAVTRKLVGKLLRSLGVSFDECENGQEAVAKARANKFLLILMDKEMPVMDGYEATRQIRVFNSAVPIVGVTGNAMDFQRQEFLASGVDKVVSKPIGKEGLVRLLESFGVV